MQLLQKFLIITIYYNKIYLFYNKIYCYFYDMMDWFTLNYLYIDFCTIKKLIFLIKFFIKKLKFFFIFKLIKYLIK